MIINASQYKFVTGLDKFTIDGNIMPVTLADKIRGVDIAYINEMAQQINIAGYSAQYYSKKEISDAIGYANLSSAYGETYLDDMSNEINVYSGSASVKNNVPAASTFSSKYEHSYPQIASVSTGDEIEKQRILDAFNGMNHWKRKGVSGTVYINNGTYNGDVLYSNNTSLYQVGAKWTGTGFGDFGYWGMNNSGGNSGSCAIGKTSTITLGSSTTQYAFQFVDGIELWGRFGVAIYYYDGSSQTQTTVGGWLKFGEMTKVAGNGEWTDTTNQPYFTFDVTAEVWKNLIELLMNNRSIPGWNGWLVNPSGDNAQLTIAGTVQQYPYIVCNLSQRLKW